MLKVFGGGEGGGKGKRKGEKGGGRGEGKGKEVGEKERKKGGLNFGVGQKYLDQRDLGKKCPNITVKLLSFLLLLT